MKNNYREKIYQKMQDQYSQQVINAYNKKSGIYKIMVNHKVVYVGQSKDLLNRFLAHKYNTLNVYSNEFEKTKYQELRWALAQGYNVSIELLEYCPIEKLNEYEDFWINYFNPALNIFVPDGHGGHRKKRITLLQEVFD